MLLARLEDALDDVVPAAALLVAADRRHQLGRSSRRARWYVSFGAQRVHPHEVPGDLQVVADDGAVLLPAVRRVVRPVLGEPLVHERAVVVVREVLGDRVEGVLEEVGVPLLARGQVEVDQVGRRVVADGVPVLLGPVRAQRLGVRARAGSGRCGCSSRRPRSSRKNFANRLQRALDVGHDPRVAGDAVGLRRAGQRVDLLVHRDGVVVVAELRGEQLASRARPRRGRRGTSRSRPRRGRRTACGRAGSRCPSRRPRGTPRCR